MSMTYAHKATRALLARRGARPTSCLEFAGLVVRRSKSVGGYLAEKGADEVCLVLLIVPVRELRWFGCLRLSLRISSSYDSRTLRRCIHSHHSIASADGRGMRDNTRC
jgi:hypothetical protein